MLLSELIEKLQKIQSEYDKDLEIITIAEIGVVTINKVLEAYTDDEDELITLDEDNEIEVNSVFLSWN
jgi:hypothetical protein